MYLIKNNPKHPITIFENSIFVIYTIVIAVFTIMAFLDNQTEPAVGLLAFDFAGVICLYFNNRAIAYVSDSEITIRKAFKKYKYELKQIESIYYDERLRKYVLNFEGKTFTFLDLYLNINKLVATLKMANNYFASKEGIAKLKNYFYEHASKTDFVLEPVKDKTAGLFTTKIGGVPYWDFAKEYPVDSNGNKMHLLCQLNFGECNFKNDILPKEGILQFFICSSDDFYDFYGMDLSEPTAQKNYRIVFHEKIDKNASEEEIKKIVPNQSEITSTPVIDCTALDYSQSISYMDISDYRINDVIRKAAKEITGEEADSEKNLYEILGTEEENIYSAAFYHMITENESHVLGFPSFIQDDVRGAMSEKEAAYYDTVLLHLESVNYGSEVMCWGDAGCANFLINSEALKNRDFSKVYYTWDCY